MSQITACAIAWTAAIVAITALVLMARRARRGSVRWEIDGNVITFDRKLTAAEVEKFRAEWLRRYGSGRANGVCACTAGGRCVWHGVQKVIKEASEEESSACPAYRPPVTPADSGLCARCGMYDYKHQEATSA